MLVTVILPVRNGEPHIGEQLAALAAQDHDGPWELLVVDNGCRDRTLAMVREWAPRLPAVRVVRAPRGLNRARNAGVQAARGDFLAFCDADDVVTSGWLRALVEAGAEGDIVGGVLDHSALNGEPVSAWREAKARDALTIGWGYLPYVPGGNCAMWADVARSLGWDEAFRYGSSDQEFSWRAQLASFTLVLAPEAVVQQRYRGRRRELARQYFAYGMSAPLLYRRFRVHGMPPPSWSEAVGAWRYVVRHAHVAVSGPPHVQGHWVRTAATRAGRLAGSIRWGCVYP